MFDEEGICDKCGGEDISVTWCRGVAKTKMITAACARIYDASNYNTNVYSECSGEHMERIGVTGGDYWLEKPLDSAAPLERLAVEAV